MIFGNCSFIIFTIFGNCSFIIFTIFGNCFFTIFTIFGVTYPWIFKYFGNCSFNIFDILWNWISYTVNVYAWKTSQLIPNITWSLFTHLKSALQKLKIKFKFLLLLLSISHCAFLGRLGADCTRPEAVGSETGLSGVGIKVQVRY